MAGSRSFGQIAELVRETVDPSTVPHVPYVALEHIGEGTLSLTGHGLAGESTSTKSRFRSGDILFGKLRPYFRKVVRPDFDGVCSTDIWVVRPQPGVDAGYLFYLMASDAFIEPVVRASEGTKMPRAKWEYASRLEFELPPGGEQREIASILGTLDEKIELNRAFCNALDETAQTVFKSWFVSMDGRDLDSLTGVPAGWERRTLGSLCEKPQYGYTESGRTEAIGPRFLRIADINKQPWIEWDSVPYCPIDESDLTKYRLHRGDLVIARIADPGHAAYIETNEDAVFASYLIRFRPRDPAHGRFLQYWLKSDAYWNLVRGRASGSTRANLNAQVLSSFPLVLPTSDVLGDFSAVVGSLRERISLAVTQTSTLAHLRDTLLPRLLSGELRISDAEVIVEEVL